MSGRDLLYKPSVPQQLPDEQTEGKKSDKLGVKAPRGRDLGQVGETVRVRVPAGRTQTQQARPAAHKATYFNKDISGVREVNQRASGMRALRGSEGATDLKKVVLPPAAGIDTPDPAQLREAGELMGLDGGLDLSLESLLGRQSGWLRGKGVTAEIIQQRLAQLEEMVKARKSALERMAAAGQPALSVTVEQAVTANGNALETTEDVVDAGRELVERTAQQAAGMHYRLAKMLGLKTQ